MYLVWWRLLVVGLLKSICQRGEDGEYVARITTVLLIVMLMVRLVREDMQPESQNNSTDMRAPAGYWGNMCASIADSGRPDRLGSYVCVLTIVPPSGITAVMGDVATRWLIWGILILT